MSKDLPLPAGPRSRVLHPLDAASKQAIELSVAVIDIRRREAAVVLGGNETREDADAARLDDENGVSAAMSLTSK